MANLWLLLKIQILRLLTGGQKSKRKAINSKKIGTGALLFVLFFGLSISYAFMYAEVAAATGQYVMMIQAMLVIYLALSVFFGIYDAVGSLFGNKDYDYLASLPIKRGIIVFSKLLYTYLLDFVIAIIIFVPTVIIFATKVEVSALFFFTVALNCLFIPFIPLVFTLIIGIGIKLIFSGVKKKALFETVFTIVIAIGLGILLSLSEDNLSIYSFIEKVPVINWFIKGLFDFKYSLFFAGTSLAIGLFVCYIVSVFYSKLHTLLSRQKTSGNYKIKSAKQNSLTATLVKKEFTTLLGIPLYAVNVLVSPIMGIGIIVFLVAFIRAQVPVEMVKMVIEVYAPYLLPILMFTGGIMPMAAPSVSLEGKNFGLVKTLPLAPRKLIGAKYFASFIVSAVNIIIPAFIAVIGFAVPVVYSIIIVLCAILGCFIVNSVAMTFGIIFAKFEWDNPAYVVKQSASVFCTMLVNLALTGVLALIGWLVSTKVSVDLAMWLSLVYIALICVASTLVLLKYSVKRFEKL